jgi:hypothetical protein
LAFCIVAFSFTTNAQSASLTSSGITLSASSDNPTPGQTVTITAASYSFDIDTATIIWDVNSKQQKKDVGATTFQVNAPAIGKQTIVDVTAVTPDGANYSKSITISSGSIDMIIETDGYVPPFFKGKTPFVFQNTIKVIAMPRLADSFGHLYDPANLIYNWKEDNGTILSDQSGYGKQSISLKGNIVPRPYYLMVTASSRDGYAQGQSLVYINPQSPSITFYNDDQTYGPLFNKAIGSTIYIGTQKDVQALAVPFGFNLSAGNSSSLNMDWLVNGTERSDLASDRSVSLRAPDDTSGTSDIELDISGISNILQSASASFSVSFKSNTTAASSTPITF